MSHWPSSSRRSPLQQAVDEEVRQVIEAAQRVDMVARLGDQDGAGPSGVPGSSEKAADLKLPDV